MIALRMASMMDTKSKCRKEQAHRAVSVEDLASRRKVIALFTQGKTLMTLT